MKDKSLRNLTAVALLLIATPSMLLAQLEITSFTIDAGGGYSAGGTLEIEGTLGQPDAGPVAGAMTGGAFSLQGGFWPGVPVVACTCPGDMNADGTRNGADIQLFVNCMVGGGACGCADVDGTPGMETSDVTQFVSDLLNAAACP